jgi:SAM-dependent methyltransferase
MVAKALLSTLLRKKARTLLLLFSIAVCASLMFANLGFQKTVKGIVYEKSVRYSGGADIYVTVKQSAGAEEWMDAGLLAPYAEQLEYAQELVQGKALYVPGNTGEQHYFTVLGTDIDEFNARNPLYKRSSSEGLSLSAEVCNILDMSGFGEASFDVVLCMGALYHLFTAEDRKRAVDECLRVLKPGGLFAAAYISRHAQLILALAHKGMEKYDAALECIENGVFDAEDGALVFYRSTPSEIISLMASVDLEKQYMVAADGAAHIIAELINNMNPSDFDRWLQYHYSTCEDETLLGYSLHGLYIGRKRQGTSAAP